ncbi:MAG: response regulator [Chloroflexi bacterium]|nr:response regulator [Chloroflexota bacterium]
MSLIVIIEDNEQSSRLAARLLQRDGHEVLVADDGEMGLTTVLENQPDLILIDLGLPDLDGQTVVAMLRQHGTLQHIPIIAFTAWPETTAREMVRAYGCDGVISKPIDTRQFAQQVNSFIQATTRE